MATTEPTVTWEKEMAEKIRANAAARSPEAAAKGPYMELGMSIQQYLFSLFTPQTELQIFKGNPGTCCPTSEQVLSTHRYKPVGGPGGGGGGGGDGLMQPFAHSDEEL
eukprot:gene17582-27803_t